MNTQTPFAAPVVDRLSVRVVVDSHYERFLPKTTHPFVAIEHVGQIPGRQMTTLAGEWGLSLHLDSESGGAPHALEGGFTSGYIERASFEKTTGGTLAPDGEADGAGVSRISIPTARMERDMATCLP